MFNHIDKATSVTESEFHKQHKLQDEIAANENNLRQQALISWHDINTTKEFLKLIIKKRDALSTKAEEFARSNDVPNLRRVILEKATLNDVLQLAHDFNYKY